MNVPTSTCTLFLFILIIVSLVAAGSKLVLHTGNSEKTVTLTEEYCGSGAFFTENYDFSCVCATGLWAFFEESCEQVKVVVGGTNGQCIPVDFRIRKVNRLSPPVESLLTSSASSFDREMTSVGDRFISVEGIPGTAHFIPSGFPIVITTGRQSWRLTSQKKCIQPVYSSNVTHFCLFDHKTEEEYRMEDTGCFNGDEIVIPIKCVPYMNDNDYELEINPRTCDHIFQQRRRVRREIEKPTKQGRIFLGANDLKEDGGASPENITQDDENHGMSIVGQPALNSEIWNYMTLRAQKMLGIHYSNKVPTDSSHSIAFSLLNLAKKIQQQNCPDHYVTDDHYDLAITAFIALQRNNLKFTDTFIDFPTSERIEEALSACLANITEPYPFIERTGFKTQKTTNTNCVDYKPTEHGSYFKFEKVLELNIGSSLASRNNEPIIETVWKVFVHAHSACYPFFKDNYNDHHRFTSIMFNMFTNDIHDIWFNVTELKPDIYSGFLGDAVDLMDSVAYCSLFSRLESEYPWDLPRPKKNNARRKRQVKEKSYTNYQCLEEWDARNFCRLDSAFVDGSNQ